MKRRNLLRIGALAPAGAILSSCATTEDTVEPGVLPSGRAARIACVGDSITFGFGMDDPVTQSWPAQLQKLLDADPATASRFRVRNFGVSGATAQRESGLPYWELPQLREAKAFEPDIVIVALGTNDSKEENWVTRSRFADDYQSLLEHFKNLPSSPELFACLPIPAWKSRFGLDAKTIQDGVVPAVRIAAKRSRVPTIDLHNPLVGQKRFSHDEVHLNQRGSREVARLVREALGI